MNLEIYEYVLNGYTNKVRDNSLLIYKTESIDVSSDEECGIIKVSEPPAILHQNISIPKISRSCDPIKGTLAHVDFGTNIILDNKLSLDTNFNIDGITRNDLIKFSNIYGAKQIKRQKISDTSLLPSMTKLYNFSIIKKVITDIASIIVDDWKITSRSTQYINNHTLIKIIKPTIEHKFIIFGDIHGSFATFMRHLIRLREMNIFDNNCRLRDNYNLIFLGDMIDRGVYGYEIVMLIFLLKIQNPTNVHINRGNHEETNTNTNYGFLEQINIQFEGDAHLVYDLINTVFTAQHSALLLQNPINDKYIYLAHGGLPLQDGFTLHPLLTPPFNNNIEIPNAEIIHSNTNSIRWSDFHSKAMTILGERSLTGRNIITEANNIGIELIVRGHQDSEINTKILINELHLLLGQFAILQDPTSYPNYININNINRIKEKNNKFDYSHIIRVDNNDVYVNDTIYKELLPVITLSTNTDNGRDLSRDSFGILRFTNSVIAPVVDDVMDDQFNIYGDIDLDNPIYNPAGSFDDLGDVGDFSDLGDPDNSHLLYGGYYKKYIKYVNKLQNN